jgi:FkbM family methyltransferase
MFAPPQSLIDKPLLRRLLPSLWKRYMRLLKAPYFVESRLGLRHLIDQSNSIDRNLVIKGFWERAQMDYFSSRIREFIANGQTVEFWDIGAHAGLYSLYLARHCGLDVVHAFEPDHRSHAQLHANLFINQMTDRIRVHKLAVSDKEGEVRFFMARTGNRGASRISQTGREQVIGETVVRAVRLDDYLKPQCDIIAMKIDVEEHELQVLDGMSRLLAGHKAFIQLEIFDENEHRLLPYLQGKGFRLLNKVVYDHFFINFDADSATG